MGSALKLPHVHVDGDDLSAKFWLDHVGLARNFGFTRVRSTRETMLVQIGSRLWQMASVTIWYKRRAEALGLESANLAIPPQEAIAPDPQLPLYPEPQLPPADD